MQNPIYLGLKIQRLEKQLDELAHEICEVDGDFDSTSPKNKKYAELRKELRDLDKQKNELVRVFMAHTY